MKPLRDLLDKQAEHFEEGGKLEKLYPFYEAGDTFLYTPGEVTRADAHVRDGMDLKRMMITVVLSLQPCILMALYNTGLQAEPGLSKYRRNGHGRLAYLDRPRLGLVVPTQ